MKQKPFSAIKTSPLTNQSQQFQKSGLKNSSQLFVPTQLDLEIQKEIAMRSNIQEYILAQQLKQVKQLQQVSPQQTHWGQKILQLRNKTELYRKQLQRTIDQEFEQQKLQMFDQHSKEMKEIQLELEYDYKMKCLEARRRIEYELEGTKGESAISVLPYTKYLNPTILNVMDEDIEGYLDDKGREISLFDYLFEQKILIKNKDPREVQRKFTEIITHLQKLIESQKLLNSKYLHQIEELVNYFTNMHELENLSQLQFIQEILAKNIIIVTKIKDNTTLRDAIKHEKQVSRLLEADLRKLYKQELDFGNTKADKIRIAADIETQYQRLMDTVKIHTEYNNIITQQQIQRDIMTKEIIG
ncbi:Hypothetical_protein [Hexamita inflata]|uniref:Hypothetical_protein n=1 Tax=Hexamita inflata TaxID=28002 RepID=A0AA86RAZ5_9EUKA|nr:Hypothetical protein HINF_LOCUS58948 [Hexamita inflata]